METDVKQFTVYALTDSRGVHAVVFYVGRTNNPRVRLWHHIKRAKLMDRHEPVITYIRQMLDDGVKPELVVLQAGSGDAPARKRAEDAWICHYRDMGAPLQNAQEGGEFGYQHSPETRLKMGEAIRRTKSQPEHKAKASESARLRWMDPDVRKRNVEAIREVRARQCGFATYEDLVKRDAEILALYIAGATRAALARQFGIQAIDVGNAVARARKRDSEVKIDQKARKRAYREAQTHCKNGHPWTEENTYWPPNRNYRACRACKRDWEQAYRQG